MRLPSIDTLRARTLLITFLIPSLGSLSLSSLSLGSLLVGCGGSAKPPGYTDEDEPGEEQQAQPHGLSAEAEIGALDEGKVSDTFRDALPGLQKCLVAGSKRLEFIGGNITFFIKINKQHEVVHAHAAESTLGDRKTELCMFDVLKAMHWPAPEGGEIGIAKNPFEFDNPVDVRSPVIWNESQVSSQRSALSGELSSCKHGAGGRFSATLYIDTDGSPLSGSVTPPDEAGEGAVDCLVGVLLGAKYDSPGSWPAKVTLDL
jgi:hypothetical protein